ncbi:MAG: HEAT repeat domain-containing protein, partial [Planctomycetaceae bacterium]|nr:HEAT repeat domain-containing protein [Planctomycetaceae bacterium]
MNHANRKRQVVQASAAASVGLLWALLNVPLAVLHAADPSLPQTSQNVNPADDPIDEEDALDLTLLTNEQLLERFERAPFGSVKVSTGGGYENFLHTIEEVCRYAEFWERQHQRRMEQDFTVREVIRRGDVIQADIHNKITHAQLPQSIRNPLSNSSTPGLYEAYAYVAGQIGDRETVIVLTDLLREALGAIEASISSVPHGEVREIPRLGLFTQHIAMVSTHALWQLTGRRHGYSPDEWEQYLAIIGDDFVPAHKRSRHVPDPAAVERYVRRLVREPFESREWLIAQGPNIVPQLLRSLGEATDEHAVQIAWVMDEIGATDQVPLVLRRRYFDHRLSQHAGTPKNEFAPLDNLSRRRALEHLPFADFVEIALDAEPRLHAAGSIGILGWLHSHQYDAVSMKFGTLSIPLAQLNAPHSPWAGITPLDDPATELEAAVPALVEAIRSPDPRRRRLGIWFANTHTRFSKSKPSELIEALRECWIEHHDRDAGEAMAQFRTPAAIQAVLDVLQTNDLTMLTQAMRVLDVLHLAPSEYADVFRQVLEYTHHPLPELQRGAVYCLAHRAPAMLYPELGRLSRDPDQRIRRECIQVLQSFPNPLLANILFDVANDPNENMDLRKMAVSSLERSKYREHLERILLLLDDKDLQETACSA